MVYYKSYRIVDGKPRWVIENEDGNINKNPTNEQVRNAILEDPPKKCCKCGSRNTRIDNSGRNQWFKYYGEDNKKYWDDKSWLCSNCYHKIPNNLPDSHKNIIKSMVKYRNKNLDLYIETGKGIIGECIVGRVLGIRSCENCDILKNYDCHDACDFVLTDGIGNKEYGKIDVKTAKLIENPIGHFKWTFHTRGKIDCNYYFCLGFDREWNNIESMHIIPNDRCIIISDDIGIYKYIDPSRGSKWNEFKFDEEIFNDAYQFILSNLEYCPVFGNKMGSNI